MSNRLWINQREYVDMLVSRQGLGDEIASRSRAFDFAAALYYLPNPDPVLKAQGKDISTYRDLTVDGHLWAVMQSRFAAMSRREWRIVPADNSRAARKAADLVQDAFGVINLSNVFWEMLDAVFMGYSVLEILWENDGQYFIPSKVEEKPQEWFQFSAQNELQFKSRTAPNGETLDQDYKFLLLQNHASYRNPYGEPVLSRAFWPVVFKKGGWRFWVTFTEKYGMPWAIGKLPRGSSKTDKTAMLDALEQMVADGVATIPNDASVELMADSGRTASADLYDRLLAKCDAEMSKVILGQTLTTEIGETGGAFAASDTHADVREDISDGDCLMAVEAFNRLSGWIAALNVANAPAPKFEFVEAEDIRSDLAARDEVLGRQGVRFTKEYYIRQYNLEESDFELSEPAQPFPNLAGPGSGQMFAEGDTAVRNEARTQRERLAELAANARQEAGPALGQLLVDLAGSVRQAGSLDALRRRLPEIYDELDAGPLGEMLARGAFMANALGRARVHPIRQAAAYAEWEPLPPEQAIEYFRQKGYTLSWNWRDVWQAEHAKAFTVAHVTKLDVLQDLRGAVDRAIAEGTDFDKFQDDLTEILKSKGWWGRVTETNPKTGLPETYQAGSSRRLRTIFDTNISVAYAAGQYQARQEQLDVAPNWMYSAGMGENTCPICAALDGKVFRADDPVWGRITPPNHWGCNCDIIALSEGQMGRLGLSVSDGAAAEGAAALIPAEWNYNPAEAAWRPDLGRYDAGLADRFRQATGGE